MLPHSQQGRGPVTFVLMHFLGGSHRTWSATLPYLDRAHACIALNTPGYGDANAVTGYTVDEMADQVDASIRELGLKHCILVGHSMTGKVAVVLAARRPDYLRGLILVAPSPPGPQPMSDEDRDQQRAYTASREQAEAFVDDSSYHRLPDALREVAIADAQAVNLDAWRAWVDHGSREDWSDRIGLLPYPALLICGDDDQQVPDAQEQQRTTLSHFPNSTVLTLPGAGHLMPYQAPQALAEPMLDFARPIAAELSLGDR